MKATYFGTYGIYAAALFVAVGVVSVVLIFAQDTVRLATTDLAHAENITLPALLEGPIGVEGKGTAIGACAGSCSCGTTLECIQYDKGGVCETYHEVCAVPPGTYGNACTSVRNACGQTNSGTIQCDGTCSASVPPNSGCPAPTVSITANQTTINEGESITLTWNSTDANYCEASGGPAEWYPGDAGDDNKAIPGGSQAVSPSATATFEITCGGVDGSTRVTDSVKVTVIPTPPTPPAVNSCWALPDPVDPGATSTWQASVSGGVSPLTYVWSGSDGLSGSGATLDWVYAVGGEKTATLTVTDSNGQSSGPVSCTDLTVKLPPPVITACTVSPSPVVAGEWATWTATYTNGPVNGHSWQLGTDALPLGCTIQSLIGTSSVVTISPGFSGFNAGQVRIRCAYPGMYEGPTTTVTNSGGRSEPFKCPGMYEILPPPPAIDGVCGPADGTYTASESGYNGAYCDSGTEDSSPTFPSPGTTVNWNCEGSGVGHVDDSCSATRLAPAINGICGGRDGTYTVSDTTWTGAYCDSGTEDSSPTFPSPGTTVNWNCEGSGVGHVDDSCSATRFASPVSSPVITANKIFARYDEPVNLMWSLGTYDALLCSITKNGADAGFNVTSGSGTDVMQSTVTYTIDCSGDQASVTVELIPGLWEG